MPNTFYATVSTAGTSTVWIADHRINPFNANVQVYVPGGTTVSYEVDFTLDSLNPPPDIIAPPVEWTPLVTFPAGSTSTTTALVNASVYALRLNVASISGGPVYFKVMQPDFIATP